MSYDLEPRGTKLSIRKQKKMHETLYIEQLLKVHLETWKLIFTPILPKDLQFI